MFNIQEHQVTQRKIDPDAALTIRKHVKEFATVLILQSKILAYKRGDNVVVNSHIEEALSSVRRKQDRDWKKELLIIFGGVFFGAFVPGFITELSAGRTIYVLVYTVLGFFGLIMVFAGLQR